MPSIARVAMLWLAAAAAASPVSAAKVWNKTENIKASAERLALMQRARGATGTYEFIFNCYKTHRLASDFSEPLEGCIVQDYIHSKVTAAVYERVDAETRKKFGAPSAEQLMALMSARVVDAYRQYGIADAEIKSFMKLVDKQGLPVFLAKRFPDSGATDDEPGSDDAPPASASPPPKPPKAN